MMNESFNDVLDIAIKQYNNRQHAVNTLNTVAKHINTITTANKLNLFTRNFHLATIVSDFSNIEILKDLQNNDDQPKVILINNTVQFNDSKESSPEEVRDNLDDLLELLNVPSDSDANDEKIDTQIEEQTQAISKNLMMDIVDVNEFVNNYPQTIIVDNTNFNKIMNQITNAVTNSFSAIDAFNQEIDIPEIFNYAQARKLQRNEEINQVLTSLQDGINKALTKIDHITLSDISYLKDGLPQSLNEYGDELIAKFEIMVTNVENQLLTKFPNAYVGAHLVSDPWDMEIEINLHPAKH